MEQSNWIQIFESIEGANRIFKSHEIKRILIDGKAICFGRIDEKFYAIGDECPHQSASLGMGECNQSGQVQCPFHHYLFDLKTGFQIGAQCNSVKSYQVRQDQNGISILLD